ncbi:DUF1569 domain-containing protein [Hymenobacter cheonanensis]|uniref:DUF1569 domain-containing protein n=1 Tax=Hymenobacter sp. CA2-7 TaxID=3063993 RepID=UPI002712C83E|nr:DUF1569 domain-containing protein [Hymenobacter sp. CA2-7]MDO7884092.1 DUF1569 domain-containing protein [Hymenobacter sp. CA2-7]
MAPNFLDPSDNKALVSRLFRLMPDAQRRWGTMTAGQMLVHCADQLRVSRGEKPVASLRVPGLLKPLLKWYFVTRLTQFKPGMKTLYELDAQSGMTPPVSFATDHATLLRLLAPAGYRPGGIDHPLFGHLSAQEFGEITWKHLDHHLRQFGV